MLAAVLMFTNWSSPTSLVYRGGIAVPVAEFTFNAANSVLVRGIGRSSSSSEPGLLYQL